MATKTSFSRTSTKKSSSSTGNKNIKAKTLSQLPVKLDKNDTVSITEIENGFLVNQSGYTGKGKNQQWYNKQYFTPNNPLNSIPTKVKFGKK